MFNSLFDNSYNVRNTADFCFLYISSFKLRLKVLLKNRHALKIKYKNTHFLG